MIQTQKHNEDLTKSERDLRLQLCRLEKECAELKEQAVESERMLREAEEKAQLELTVRGIEAFNWF